MTGMTSVTLLAQGIRNSDGALVYPLGHHASIGVWRTQVEIGFQKPNVSPIPTGSARNLPILVTEKIHEFDAD